MKCSDNTDRSDDLQKNIFEKTTFNKSMFTYITNPVNYKNKNECTNYTPPFISYIPIGVPQRNINLDSSLRGMNQYLSKCTEYKYRQDDNEKEFKMVNLKKNEKECDKEFNIVPSGYIPYPYNFKKPDSN